MLTLEQENTLKQAIKTFGVKNQLDMVVEECAELIQAINKIKRSGEVYEHAIGKPHYNDSVKYCLSYNNLCSEVADVKIMINQLEMMLNKEAIDISFDRKIERLNKRMNG